MMSCSRRPAATSRLRAIGRDESGLALVEFALVLPFFVAALLTMIDTGMAIFVRAQVQTAAQAGIDYAAVKSFNANGISAAAVTATSTSVTVAAPTSYYACVVNGTLTSVSTATTCSSGLAAGQYASLTVSAVYTPILSALWQGLTGSSTVTLSFTTVGPTS